MKALILVGGFGTRLRPLTLKIPKPLVPFCNMPIVEHQIAALEKVGVNEVVLAINYKPEHMQSFVERMKAEHPTMTIHCSQEKTPLGTAGPIRLAQEVLKRDGEPFFVLNSDVICSFPLQEFIDFHTSNKANGALGTIMVTKVEEPSKYGVVVFDEAGKISSFVEKPQVFVGNKINAGIYILEPAVMDAAFFPKEGESASIEKQVFPNMAAGGQLFAYVLPGFWMDVGQPRDYLTGMERYLEYLQEQSSDKLAPAEGALNERVIVSDSAKIGDHCAIGPDVVIGPDCIIEDGVRLRRCVVMEGAHIKAHSWVHSSIVGWHSVVGSWCRVEGTSVLGEDVKIKDELYVNGGTILPNKTIKESINEPRIVM